MSDTDADIEDLPADPAEIQQAQQKDEAHGRDAALEKGESHEGDESRQEDESHQKGESDEKGESHKQGESDEKGESNEKGESHKQGESDEKGESNEKGESDKKGEPHETSESLEKLETEHDGDAQENGEAQDEQENITEELLGPEIVEEILIDYTAGVSPEDFDASPEVQNSDQFISKPFLSECCTMQENILEFHHSFGYDCKRYYNLTLMGKRYLIFASGNYLNFFNAETREFKFRRSAGGGGIGHIAVHPTLPHIAIGEKGVQPLLIIYKWPSFEVICTLEGGTEFQYTYLNYSPDGDLLCSQGGEPDYMLTIWDWKRFRILLRGKAHGQDVIQASFSCYVPGHLTSCGSGHIKFWKMARTFTGLKLMGSLGRFGKTEISDIIGFVALPNEKVLSGSSWGNLLLWDEGLIKVEVFRIGRKMCHAGPITHIHLEKREIITFGLDGVARMWNFETIDSADPPAEDPVIELLPLFEFNMGSADVLSSTMSVVKKDPKKDLDFAWFVQDANGGLWNAQLREETPGRPQERLFTCHSGPIRDMAASPFPGYLATLGEDGRLHFYNIVEKNLLMAKQFPGGGRCLEWLPLDLESSGEVLLAGFTDGVIRVIVASLKEKELSTDTKKQFISPIQVSKPHVLPITTMVLNKARKLVVTGSEDKTIFIYQLVLMPRYVVLNPIGFIEAPGMVTYLTWKPNVVATILICCYDGNFVEVKVPDRPMRDNVVSYKLTGSNRIDMRFKSVKSEIRRQIKIEQIEAHKSKKREEKRVKMEETREANPGMDIDEELFLADSESEEELEPLYYPEVPNPIFFAIYTAPNVVWLSVGGYDAGYMYEYKLREEDPLRCTMIEDADDIEIQSFLYDAKQKYLIFGMQDGQIRINLLNPADGCDLKNYWIYPMHDNFNGKINRMCFSHDQHYFFSCGNDGNIFSYQVNVEAKDYITAKRRPTAPTPVPPEDIVEEVPEHSLEEVKKMEEYEYKMKLANERKQSVVSLINECRETFLLIMERNNKLPASQVIPRKDFEIDGRITADLEDSLQAEMDLVKRKLAFSLEKSRIGLQKVHDYFIKPLESFTVQVIGLRSDVKVSSFRQLKLGEEHENARNIVQIKLEEAVLKGRKKGDQIAEGKTTDVPQRKVADVDSFLKGLPVTSVEYKLNLKLQRAVEKYKQRKLRKEMRQYEWSEMFRKKPNPDDTHPDDIQSLKEAEETIGDYKLKTAADYRVPPELRVSTVKKYEELLNIRETIYLVQKDFNDKVFALRAKKLALIERFKYLGHQLNEIHRELTHTQIKKAPKVPTFQMNLEFPEKEAELTEEEIQRHIRKARAPSNILARKDLSKHSEPLEEELECLLVGDNTVVGRDILKVVKSVPPYSRARSSVTLESLVNLGDDDKRDTPYENELKKLRLARKLFQQDLILMEIERKTVSFDEKVQELREAKFKVEVNAKFLEVFLLQLHEELIILRDFEAMEDNLSEKVHEKLAEKHAIYVKSIELQNQIELRKHTVDDIGQKMQEISKAFTDATSESKFADFLKRIYKKKYKPPKLQDVDDEDEDESSSSDDSSSDSDDDGESIESGDLGPLRLDENECPDGCDAQLYDLTFKLRSDRHLFEQALAEEKKASEAVKKDIEMFSKKVKVVDNAYKVCQEELEMFQHKKQEKLNEIEGLVILKLSQMQHFKDSKHLEYLKNTLVFSETELKKLNNRVGELDRETKQQKNKHRVNRLHLHRMKVDCGQMEQQIGDLNARILECMIQKFGRKVHPEKLEEAILRREINGMKSTVSALKKEYDTKLASLQNKVHGKTECISRIIQENTEKLNLLTVLEEEKNKLESILKDQASKIAYATTEPEDQYSADLEKLTQIMKKQALQIQSIRREIKLLSMKTRPLPPISPAPAPPAPAETAQESTTSEEESSEVSSVEETVPHRRTLSFKDEEEGAIRAAISDIIKGAAEHAPRGVLTDIIEEATGHSERISQGILTEVTEQAADVADTVQGTVTEIIEGTVASSAEQIAQGIMADLTEAATTSSAMQIAQSIITDVIEKRTPDVNAGEAVERVLTDVIRDVMPGSEQVARSIATGLMKDVIPSSRDLAEAERDVSASDEIVQYITQQLIYKLFPGEEVPPDAKVVLEGIINDAVQHTDLTENVLSSAHHISDAIASNLQLTEDTGSSVKEFIETVLLEAFGFFDQATEEVSAPPTSGEADD